jgi:putative sterol carrier protein
MASTALNAIKRRLSRLVASSGGFDGTVLIDLGQDGALLVERYHVSESDRQKLARASLTIGLMDLDQFLGGQLNAQMLLMTRRLTIAGRMAEALRFARHLELSIYGRSALPV